jgi:hypothetical protein
VTVTPIGFNTRPNTRFETLLLRWTLDFAKNPALRLGQSLMNTTRQLWPEADEIAVIAGFDCYNDNAKIPGYLDVVQNILDEVDYVQGKFEGCARVKREVKSFNGSAG